LLHELVRRLGGRGIADGHGDRHEPRELGERQRVVAGREVTRRRNLALDEEQVGTMLGAERPEPARSGGRGGNGRR
jgi:hypothetical protein